MLPKMYSGKSRSFFFATFEKTHAEEQTSTSFRTLPTREFQNGDFSRLFDPRTRAFSSAPSRRRLVLCRLSTRTTTRD